MTSQTKIKEGKNSLLTLMSNQKCMQRSLLTERLKASLTSDVSDPNIPSMALTSKKWPEHMKWTTKLRKKTIFASVRLKSRII